MRVVFITETFSRKMGYLEHTLAKYLARLGAEVHVLTTDLQPYYQLPDFESTYGTFAKENELRAGTIEEHDGYRLHILPHRVLLGYVRMRGMGEKLAALRPDVVQAFNTLGWLSLEAAVLQPISGFRLFTGNHTALTGFPQARDANGWNLGAIKTLLSRTMPGRIVSWRTEKCYGVTSDCAEIAWRFFGVQRSKIETMHLGVDSDFFFPIDSGAHAEDRLTTRRALGFDEKDIVCIYTGKLNVRKNALILAEAIKRLRSAGYPYCGLFIGQGAQQESIRAYDFCKVLDFMDYRKLGNYYRAADVGVWPTNESTSMLDAAACGLPIVVSDAIVYREHVNGNGLVFRVNDIDSLMETLVQLTDQDKRGALGSLGAKKMAREFSMRSVAERRLQDYKRACQH